METFAIIALLSMAVLNFVTALHNRTVRVMMLATTKRLDDRIAAIDLLIAQHPGLD